MENYTLLQMRDPDPQLFCMETGCQRVATHAYVGVVSGRFGRELCDVHAAIARDDRIRDFTNQMPTDAELLRSLRVSWEERGRILDKLLVARMFDLVAVSILIDRSPNSDALSELRAVILDAVEVIKGLRKEMDGNLTINIPRISGTNQGGQP